MYLYLIAYFILQAKHPPISLEHATAICRDIVQVPANIEAVHLIYGQPGIPKDVFPLQRHSLIRTYACCTSVFPGDGKTHFVKRMLRERCEYHSTTITVNEGFTTKGAILELLSIPENAVHPTVFFNFAFTLLPADYKV